MGKVYDAAYKAEVCKRIVDGEKSVAAVSRELGINKNSLYTWMTRYRKNSSLPFFLAHRMCPRDFTRSSGKMTFECALRFLLGGIKKSLQIALDLFSEQPGGCQPMTKQAFSQLRKKISPLAFVELNDKLVEWLYDDDSCKKFLGYRLLAIDGSITEIPNTVENREYFGYYHNQSDRHQARSMVSVIYDVENDIILESKICD